jgi:hypothetical protein
VAGEFVVMATIAVGFALIGPGRYSIDRAFDLPGIQPESAWVRSGLGSLPDLHS